MNKSSREFPYKVLIPKMKHQHVADKWCEQQFGPCWDAIRNRQGIWCCFWRGLEVPETYEWLFQNQRDANWFILRWGGQ